MRIAVLTANLGEFDKIVPSLSQNEICTFVEYNDENFPPVEGLTSRLQYRIPKLFGWEMMPRYDIYLWLDGSMSLQRPDSVSWFLNKLGDNDIALFRHPWRKTIKEEVEHISQKLHEGNRYLTARYKNGLHKEQYAEILKDKEYQDNILYTSTTFIYRNTPRVQAAMKLWWYYQSRYYTCDQVVLPYVMSVAGLKVSVIEEDQFKNPYVTLVSHHK